MSFLIVFAILTVALVAPVMIGARVVGARNTGFGSALLAVIIIAACSAAIDGLVGNDIVSFVVTAVVGAAVLSGILGTSFFRGLAISVIAAIIQVVVLLVFAGALLGGGAALA